MMTKEGLVDETTFIVEYKYQIFYFLFLKKKQLRKLEPIVDLVKILIIY